ncbi:MAG: tetratricopeptide repeat protein [Phycisphaerae bacterium]
MRTKRDKRKSRRTSQTQDRRRRGPEPEPKTGHTRFEQTLALPILIIIAGAAVYANSFDGVFVFDDSVHIVQNERIVDLSDLPKVLSGKRPVVDLSLAVNYAVGELEPTGYHAVNLAVHLLAALALYGVINQTLRLGTVRKRFGSLSPWLPLAVSVIWVVHPLQTQSVTYVVQRAESMMGLFYLATLYCVVRGTKSRRSLVWYVAAVASCGLGMGCKAVMVSAPIVTLLFDRLLITGSFKETLRSRWALYVGLFATWAVLWLTGIGPGVLDPARRGATVGFGFHGMTPIEYGLTQFGVLVHYLRLSLWPHPLCLDYGWPIARTAIRIVPPALIILVLLAGTVFALIRRPWLGFFGVWFFAVLAPTSTVIPIKDTLFEHRMYLPLAAVVVLVVALVHAVLGRMVAEKPKRRAVASVLVTVVCLALGAKTIARNRVYHTAERLWRDVAATRPNNARAFENLGTVLMVNNRIEDAIPEYQRAVALDPDFVSAQCNLANALSQTGKFEDAIRHYDEVLRVDPFHPDANINRAHALDRSGHVDEAIEAYEAAAALDPASVSPEFLARVHANLASVLANQGELDGAVVSYREAVRLNPDYALAYYWWGVVLFKQGRLDEAIARFNKTLSLEPTHAGARRRLEQALEQKSRLAPH